MEFLSPPTTPKRAFRSRGESISGPGYDRSPTRSNLLFLQGLDGDADITSASKNPTSLLDSESGPGKLNLSLIGPPSLSRSTTPTAAAVTTPTRTSTSTSAATTPRTSFASSQGSSTPIKTPDRFIPNRGNIDFDICNR